MMSSFYRGYRTMPLYAELRLFIPCIIFYLLATTAYAAEVDASNQHVRTLAASCAACHGTQGNSLGVTPVLAGLESDYIAQRMAEFKSGARASTVMHHHAKGLTAEEIQQLAVYFSQQKRQAQPVLKSQRLGASHE